MRTPANWRIHATDPRTAFTLVEMLVAMAVTLLMIAALARAFGFVGERVRDSRSNVQMSDELRDLTTRISDELSRCTVSLQPNEGGEDQPGYFLYYEGPVTDSTASIFRVYDEDVGPGISYTRDDERYGDFDDYLAFTAEAKGENWFSGKVPRFVLDQKTAELSGVGYVPADFPGNPWDPIVIRSKHAEIIYFASPEYDATLLPNDPAYPRYIDVDGDTDLGSGDPSENGLPDRLKIHRRVLLIRPDLNLASGLIPGRLLNGVQMMNADVWPDATTATCTTNANLGDGWLYGMAGVHQQCDLSVRRLNDANGFPTIAVAANSLSDLAKPHNRFAHVRVPNDILTGAGTAAAPTSMPVLALGPAPTILNAVTVAPLTMPVTPTVPVRIAPPASPSGEAVVTPSFLSGFLRPEYVLGHDLTHHDSNLDVWGLERLGEDLLTNNALGFDLKIYDPEVSSFVQSTTGMVVGPNDAGYRGVIREVLADLATYSPFASSTSVDDFNPNTLPPNPGPPKPYVDRLRGGFVDLCYPVLAGGPLRGFSPRRHDRLTLADDGRIDSPDPNTENVFDAEFLKTPFSGLEYYAFMYISRPIAYSTNVYTDCLYKSGRVVTLGAPGLAGTMLLFQPAFDTYTSSYNHDGFYEFANGHTGSRWSSFSVLNAPPGVIVDQGGDGIDNDGFYGIDDMAEWETCPPFPTRPDAIRITIRLENPATRLMRQASVVHHDDR